MSNELKLTNKVSPLVKGQLPDFLQDDTHSVYSNFLKDYYRFLESARMKFSFTTNYLTQETNTVNYILEENTDRIVLEDSTEFLVNETVKGSTSGAEATVLVEDVRNSQIYITSNKGFELNETITGLTSGATATLIEFKTNPIQNIQQMLDYGNIDNAIFEYFDQFRNAFLNVIPNTLASGISKRNLVKHIKDLYAAKGTKDGHKFFMRLLFNENVDIFYPNENILNVSAGEWKRKLKLRCESVGGASAAETVGQQITGQTSGAIAVVDSASVFQQNTVSVAELDIENIIGVFQTGETITLISNESDTEVSFIIKSVITNANVINDGILNSVIDPLILDNKGNNFADVIVETIKEGSVSEILVDEIGSGYKPKEKLTFSGGNNITRAAGFITSVGGAFLLEDGSGNIVRETGTKNIEQSFNIALESTEVVDGPFYVYGTTEYNQRSAGKTGYYYPLFLTEAGAGGASNSHPHTFIEYPNITFYMPSSEVNHARVDAPTGTYDSNSYVEYPPKPNDLLILDGTDSLSSHTGDTIITNIVQVSYDNFATENEKLILEEATFSTVAEASSIRDIAFTNKGSGYTFLPTITVNTNNGSGAKILALTTDIGAANSLSVEDSGFDYSETDIPDAKFRAHFILKDVSGTFAKDNTLTSHTGTITGWNADIQQLDTTFENVIRFDMEQSGSSLSVPMVLEDNTPLNESFLLTENIQDVSLTDEDNIILNGTSAVTESTRLINVNVKHNSLGFIIDNVSRKNLRLKEGNTYRFDLSDSSLYNSDVTLNHNFKFSITPDGTHGSGVEFTDGVTTSDITVPIGTEGAFIQITIPTGTPTLYYYCANHSNEGGTILTEQLKTFIIDNGDDLILDRSYVSKFKLLIETPNGENPLLGFAFEDNSGTIILESTNLQQERDVGDKIKLDGLRDTGTAFLLDETDGTRLRTEEFGNKLLLEDGNIILFETDDTSSVGDKIVLDGTDSLSNNAGELLLNEDEIDFSGNDVVITDSSGATGTVILADISTATVNVGVLRTTEGEYISINSLLDEDLIRIQDSFYYQKFSYEVQVGQSTAAYLQQLKKAVHPAGFAPFGKVSIATFISAKVENAGKDQATPVPSTETFSPILASTFELLFDEKINRSHVAVPVASRIGTRTDKIVFNGTDGSSTDEGDSILFESGTIDQYGEGGRLMSETAHFEGNQSLVFIPTFKITVQSKARSR